MNEPQSMAIEALKIITEFLSSNSITIVVLFVLFICRNSISIFISRLTSLTYKNGKSELGMEAAIPAEKNGIKRELRTEDEKPPSDDKEAEIEKKEREWLPDMYQAFDEGRIEDAEAAFKRYALDEADEVKLEENKAFYLYLKFEKGQDNSAIDELKKLSQKATSESSKFHTLMWLSFCFRACMQYHKETEMWRATLAETKSESLKTTAIVNIASSLNKEESSDEARMLLTDRLIKVEDDKQRALLYEALSGVEESLGNKSMAIYCEDKALEFIPHNRAELFNSAYAASEEDIDEISISNYIKLIRIDENNSIALNNLGVRAQEADLKIKAVDQYKKSSEHNNTLSMANQGYLLLDAGFADEAENIAKDALKESNPHQNIHSLLAEINTRKENQKNNWENLAKKSLDRQKEIREYTMQYYLGSSKLLDGEWYANGTYPLTIKIDNGLIKAIWTEASVALDGIAYTVELVGKVSGSTIDGIYTRKRNDGSPNTLLGLSVNKNQQCIGYFREDEKEIKLISKKLKDDFSLCLSQYKT